MCCGGIVEGLFASHAPAILQELLEGPKCVTDMESYSGPTGQHLTASRRIAALSSGGLRPDGSRAATTWSRPQLVRDMLALVGRDDPVMKRTPAEIQADKDRLAKAKARGEVTSTRLPPGGRRCLHDCPRLSRLQRHDTARTGSGEAMLPYLEEAWQPFQPALGRDYRLATPSKRLGRKWLRCCAAMRRRSFHVGGTGQQPRHQGLFFCDGLPEGRFTSSPAGSNIRPWNRVGSSKGLG